MMTLRATDDSWDLISSDIMVNSNITAASRHFMVILCRNVLFHDTIWTCIGIWCNGSTPDFESVDPGSNPGIPAGCRPRGRCFYFGRACKERPETRDRITKLERIFEYRASVKMRATGLLKSRSNYVIWLLVSGLSHKPARYGSRLSIMLSGLWSLVSSPRLSLLVNYPFLSRQR